jgi:hypothetical protein
MALRMCAMKLRFHTMQKVAGVIIFVAIGINYIDLISNDYANDYFYYSMLFMVACVIDTISHSLKESIVRSQPILYDEFTFTVAIAQLIVGIVSMPFILNLSMKNEDFRGTKL